MKWDLVGQVGHDISTALLYLFESVQTLIRLYELFVTLKGKNIYLIKVFSELPVHVFL